MLQPNMLITALAALIPLIIGFIWYNPKVFGTVWLSVSGVPQERMQNAHMWKTFLLTYILSFFLGVALMPMVIHQFGVFSTLANAPDFMKTGSEINTYYLDF